MDSSSIPLRAISQAITEFEFHMSPVWRSSRPHTGVGTCGTRSSTRCARARSSLRQRGLSTASSTSAIRPSRQRRISYRKIRNRPAQRVPTGPSATTPRRSPWSSRTGACSMTNRAAATRTSSAEWYRSHAGRRATRAAAASNARPLRRTKWPPAPRGNQYRSTEAAAPPNSRALDRVPVPDVVTRQRSQVRSIGDNGLDRPAVNTYGVIPVGGWAARRRAVRRRYGVGVTALISARKNGE
jgi:hypothetical protein